MEQYQTQPNTAQAPTTEQPIAPVEPSTTPSLLPPTLVEFKSQLILSAAEMSEHAQDILTHITGAWRVSPRMNIDLNSQDVPAGYGMVVQPLQSRKGEGSGYQTEGVICAFVPTVDLLQTTEKGQALVLKAVVDSLMQKVTNSIRSEGALPLQLSDFIESRRKSGEGLSTFRQLQAPIVKTLREKGWPGATPELVRQALSNAQTADALLPHVDQTVWEGILDKLVATAKAQSLDPQVFVHWKGTRNQAEAMVSDDLGAALSELDFGA